MDPNIMKLLEEDEDETMHSGADVDAFTAELNRDIEGNASASHHPSDSDSVGISQGGSQTASHVIPQWQASKHDEIFNSQSGQDIRAMEEREHPPSHQQQTLEADNRKVGVLSHNLSIDASSQRQNDGRNFPVINSLSAQRSQEQPIHIHDLDSESDPEITSQMGKLRCMSKHPIMGMESNDQQPLLMELKDQHSARMVMRDQQVMASGSNNQQQSMAGGSQQPQGNASKLNKQVPFGLLLPIIQPQLDKDRAMQLHTLYFKLKKNEISKDGFIRHMRGIVGDQMLKMAVLKLQTQDAKNTQTASNQFQLQHQTSVLQMQHPSTNASNSTSDGNTHDKIRADSQGLQASHMPTLGPSSMTHDLKHPVFPGQGLNKQPHSMHLSQSSLPTYGTTTSSYPSFRATNAAHQMRQGPTHQNMIINHIGHTTGPTGMLNSSTFDRAHPLGETKKLQQGGLTHMQQKSGISLSMAHVKKETIDQSIEQRDGPQGLTSLYGSIKQSGNLKDEPFEMHSSRTGVGSSMNMVPTNSVSSLIPSSMEPNIASHPRSITSSMAVGNNSKAAPKKPFAGQKKQMEPPGSSPPSSKKQKTSGGFLDQSIEHLNDVTAVSGVNLREEEEQLFSGTKEDTRVSEASRQVVQEEEERLILNKIPLQKKLVEIMARSGVKNMSNEVERCLSLCVEERIRGLISSLIRLSKQRVDSEKPRHKIIVTSNVRQQILAINRKAQEEWDKKQGETDKSVKPNEPESTSGVDGDKDKDEARGRSAKANKEEDDKLRTTAANVAVRAATGVDDMLSRWQLMIEAKQKQGGSDTLSIPQPGKDVASRKSSTASMKNTRDSQEAEKRDTSAATPASVRKVGRNQVVIPQVARSISVKDVIAILEREPQMSKSPLLYRIFNKVTSDALVE